MDRQTLIREAVEEFNHKDRENRAWISPLCTHSMAFLAMSVPPISKALAHVMLQACNGLLLITLEDVKRNIQIELEDGFELKGILPMDSKAKPEAILAEYSRLPEVAIAGLIVTCNVIPDGTDWTSYFELAGDYPPDLSDPGEDYTMKSEVPLG